MTEPRVVIVGAGPAGIRAAEALVQAGLGPVVIDEQPRAGGQIYRRPPPEFVRAPRALYGFDAPRARALHALFDGLAPRLDYRPDTLAWNVWDGAVHTLHDGTLGRQPFDALILAPGAMDLVVPFAGWTLPGVYTLGGAQVALKAQGCAVGRRVAFLGTGPLLTLVAHQYLKAGVEVVGLFETSDARRLRRGALALMADPVRLGRGMAYRARLAGRVPVRHGVTPLAAIGRDAVEGLRWRGADGAEHEVACDAIAFGYGLKPETQLAELAGARFAFEPADGLWLPVADPYGRIAPRVYLAGDGAGILGARAAEGAGRRAARAALADLGLGDGAAVPPPSEAARRFRDGLRTAFPFPGHLAAGLADDVILCRCEAVTVGALRAAARDTGAREINRAKALCRVGMGRCQGRVCGVAAAHVLAAACAMPVGAVGRLRAQAPVKPIPIGACHAP
jgi:NADPH-dependent 2,4-dienoyl-CoA reductase/sulfur reductase-like enzyme